jgi:hypothetical protein
MTYQVRNRFFDPAQAAMGMGPGPLRSSVVGPPPEAVSPASGPVQGSGPGYAAANIGENRFLPNGKAMLSANDPDAPRLYAKNPGLYDLPPGMNPNGSTAAQNRHLGAAMGPNPFQMERPITMAQGGVINEPVVGRGQRSGRAYLMGEQGPEVVKPMPQQGELTDEMIQQLQAILGRNIFKTRKASPLRRSRVGDDPKQNTARGTNAPLIGITDDDVRMLASRPEFRPLINILIEAERRGGIQVTEAASGAIIGGPGSPSWQGGSQLDETVRQNDVARSQVVGPENGVVMTGGDTGRDDPLPQTPESIDPISGRPVSPTNYDLQNGMNEGSSSDYIPQESWSGSDPNPTNSSFTTTSAGPIGPVGPVASDLFQAETATSPVDLTQRRGEWGTSETPDTVDGVGPAGPMGPEIMGPPTPTPNEYGYTVTQGTPTFAQTRPIPGKIPADAPYSGPFESFETPQKMEYGLGPALGPAQAMQPYVPAPIYQQPMPSGAGSWSGSDPNPINSGAYEAQQFDQSTMDQMLAQALARSGYNSTSIDTPPASAYTGYNPSGPSIDPGIVDEPQETEAERLMRLASSGSTGGTGFYN